jgi:hypothetical protein
MPSLLRAYQENLNVGLSGFGAWRGIVTAAQKKREIANHLLTK